MFKAKKSFYMLGLSLIFFIININFWPMYFPIYPSFLVKFLLFLLSFIEGVFFANFLKKIITHNKNKKTNFSFLFFLGKRSIAMVIDCILSTLAALAFFFLLIFYKIINGAAVIQLTLLFGSLLLLLRDRSKQSSVGKRIFRIETINTNAKIKNCGIVKSILRNILLSVCYFISMYTADNKANFLYKEYLFLLIYIMIFVDGIFLFLKQKRFVDFILKMEVKSI